ncbi:hypothetical protein TNCT_181441 [Trichonephila clavata]|uniref:Uncharacterized protein n=1 Tax=Trichonephila clavata TaxID=2740835 RepID=A0A8X6JAE8_TRICU|nr:hypothetical protein TNCT_181441 [Trichonephila clavata]
MVLLLLDVTTSVVCLPRLITSYLVSDDSHAAKLLGSSVCKEGQRSMKGLGASSPEGPDMPSGDENSLIHLKNECLLKP